MKMMSKLMSVAAISAMTAVSLPAKAAVTDADKGFLAMAAQSDMNEIALSKLASDKASSPQVKMFAKKMVTDHMMLEAKMKPFAEAWGIAPPPGPDGEHQAEIDKLNGLSGADFDKEYMSAMVKDHHKALDAFKTEESSTTDIKFKAGVTQGEHVVAHHTVMADNLSGKLNA